MEPCPFGPSLSACFGLFVLTTVQKHVCVPTHSNLAHKIPQLGSASSCFAPLARPMRPGVRRSHEGGAVTSTPLGWELDESPHPHAHPVIKDFMKPLSLIPLDPSKFRENGSHPPQNGPYGRVGRQRVALVGTFPTPPLRTDRDSFDVNQLSSDHK